MDTLKTPRNVLIIPPDYSRFHSQAGMITSMIYRLLPDAVRDILPATGTHQPMSGEEQSRMFGGIPADLFRRHDWRHDVVSLGTIGGDELRTISGGKVGYDWDVQVNERLVSGHHDLIVSIGQVVPHEVAGMANYNKNIFIGTGGPDSIHKTHYLGAVCDMEKIMGRIHNPVRELLNLAEARFSSRLPKILYMLTVIGKDPNDKNVIRGFFVGDDLECFEQAAELARKVNFEILKQPLEEVLVYLPPEEFKSTWLGNKAIYRTRMALADQARLQILAPGVCRFGEDQKIDRLIRKYGYRGMQQTISAVAANSDLSEHLAAAAHLIHGSSEGRFSITYAPGHLTRDEVERAGYNYDTPDSLIRKYRPQTLRDGFNILPGGEEVYYISNPALGLWSTERKLNL
jgi:nickel-dependent lactate racemase